MPAGRSLPFPGTFDGIQIHSHQYIDAFTPHDLHGQRVLVVGMGNSAMDIACELSHRGVASQAGRLHAARRAYHSQVPLRPAARRRDPRASLAPAAAAASAWARR